MTERPGPRGGEMGELSSREHEEAQRAQRRSELWRQDPWKAWEQQYYGNAGSSDTLRVRNNGRTEHHQETAQHEDHTHPEAIVTDAVRALQQPEVLAALETFAQTHVPSEHPSLKEGVLRAQRQAEGLRGQNRDEEARQALASLKNESALRSPQQRTLDTIRRLARLEATSDPVDAMDELVSLSVDGRNATPSTSEAAVQQPLLDRPEQTLLDRGDRTENTLQLMDHVIPIAASLHLPEYIERRIQKALPPERSLPPSVREKHQAYKYAPRSLQRRLAGYIDYIAEHRNTLPEDLMRDPVITAAMHVVRVGDYRHHPNHRDDFNALEQKRRDIETTMLQQAVAARAEATSSATTKTEAAEAESATSNGGAPEAPNTVIYPERQDAETERRLEDLSLPEYADLMREASRENAEKIVRACTDDATLLLIIQQRFAERRHRAESARKEGASAHDLDAPMKQDMRGILRDIHRWRREHGSSEYLNATGARALVEIVVNKSTQRDLRDCLSTTNTLRTQWAKNALSMEALEREAKHRNTRVDLHVTRTLATYLERFHPDVEATALNGWLNEHRHALQEADKRPYERHRWHPRNVQLVREWNTYTPQDQELFTSHAAHDLVGTARDLARAIENIAYTRADLSEQIRKLSSDITTLTRSTPVPNTITPDLRKQLGAILNATISSGIQHAILEGYRKAVGSNEPLRRIQEVPAMTATQLADTSTDRQETVRNHSFFHAANALWKAQQVLSFMMQSTATSRNGR